MTKNQFRSKCKAMKKEVNALIDDRIEKILASGCLPLDDYDNNFVLPKSFFCAIGKEITFQLKPFSSEALREVKNIELFM